MPDLVDVNLPGVAIAPIHIATGAATAISTAPGTLWSIAAFTSSTGTMATATPGVVRLHNTVVSSSTAATIVYAFPISVLATSTGGALVGPTIGETRHDFSPSGLAFSVACTVDVVLNSTSQTALANARVSAVYST